MDATVIVALITALGLGSVIPALTTETINRMSGRSRAERIQAHNTGALAMRDDAWEWAHRIQEEAEERIERSDSAADRCRSERDTEAQRALRLQEYAAWLRTLLIEAGTDPSELPAWPDSEMRMTLRLSAAK